MQLNTRLHPCETTTNLPPVILLHGLFGTLDNLGVLARALCRDHPVWLIDMRNHGLSPRSDIMTYPAMAQDILETLNARHLERVILLGHSMGGKAAMAFSALAPARVASLIVLDMAPVDYQVRRHDAVFNAIEAVNQAGVTSRSAAAAIMANYLQETAVVMFLLKSFHAGQWRFNASVLKAQYPQIVGWQTLPPQPHRALFIAGETSPYLQEKFQPPVFSQFPNAQLCTIPKAGHWLHAQNPQAVLACIQNFLQSDG